MSNMSDTGNMETLKETRNTPSRDADAELGARAHMLIWSAGRKQGDVAAEMGMSSGSLGLKLKGQRGWALAEIKSIAAILHTTVAYLVGETESPHPNGSDEGLLLPRLDSNQQPIGFKPIVSLAAHRRSVS